MAKTKASSLPSNQELNDVSHFCSLLSDTNRLKILCLLANGERNVSDLVKHLNQSQPAISHHLALLRMSRVVGFRRDGKFNIYHIEPEFAKEKMSKLTSMLTGAAKK